MKKPGSMVTWWQAAALGKRSAMYQLTNGATAPTLLPNSMPRSRMGLMSSKDAAGDMLAMIRETNGAGAITATTRVKWPGETRCSGCDATMWQAQMASTSTPPATASHRSRSSTIARPFPMPRPPTSRDCLEQDSAFWVEDLLSSTSAASFRLGFVTDNRKSLHGHRGGIARGGAVQSIDVRRQLKCEDVTVAHRRPSARRVFSAKLRPLYLNLTSVREKEGEFSSDKLGPKSHQNRPISPAARASQVSSLGRPKQGPNHVPWLTPTADRAKEGYGHDATRSILARGREQCTLPGGCRCWPSLWVSSKRRYSSAHATFTALNAGKGGD
eukprot:scaffold24547_cov57-Phaeocystis_antarctica.AAC.1